MIKRIGLTLPALAAIALIGCASKIQKAEIAATASPQEEISSLETEIGTAYSEQVDVLAETDFARARSYLEEAKSDLSSGEKQPEVLDSVAYSRAYLTRARELANGRRGPTVNPILEARNAALAAGVKSTPTLRDPLKELDDDVRSASKNFNENLDQKDVARLQQGYLDLELKSIQNVEVGKAAAMIAGARRNGAKKNTPKTLNRAEIDLTTAQQTIAANRHNSPGYRDSVEKVNASSQLLVEALAASKRPGGKTVDEDAALALVASGRKISNLEGQLGTAEASVNEMSDSLRSRNQQLKGAVAAMSIQQALRDAQQQFSKDEAEVYQEGDKLLIRLKAMQFPTGKADLPETSIALLGKVKDVATNLGPAAVMVEGHTDSTGGATTNQALSQERAQVVAKYLETNGLESDRIDAVGFGYKKPIASNKSKTGRAQNRRVDVIITPQKGAATEAPQAPGTSN